MSKYANHDIIVKLIEDTDWYHINPKGELVLGATGDTALYKASDILTIIKDISTTDVAPIRYGRWCDEDSFDAHGSPIYRCSVCNKTVADNYITCHKFCLHCGADMRGVNTNE